MPFNVMARDDVSLQQLVEIDRHGGSVKKTPHPGNIYPNNLAVAQLGIQMLFYDRTIGERDQNFHPQCLIVDGKSEVIADKSLLTTHARVTQRPSRFGRRFPLGARVIDCHLRALRDALPDARCLVYTDYLRAHREIILPVLELITPVLAAVVEEYPAESRNAWRRWVARDGRIQTSDRKPAPTWNQIQGEGVYGLTSDQAGWLIPNVVGILCDGVVEALTYGASEIWHLSGPDMITYIFQLEPLLCRLYDHLWPLLGRPLPEVLTFNVVPVASMRFAVRGDRRSALDELLSAYLARLAAERRRSIRIQVAVPEKFRRTGKNPVVAGLVEEFRLERRAERSRLSQAVLNCPDVFYNIRAARYLTQYDLLRRPGSRLYVHPWGVEAPLREVSTATQFLFGVLRAIRRSLQKAE